MSSAMNEPSEHRDPTRPLDLPGDDPQAAPDETRVLTDDTRTEHTDDTRTEYPDAARAGLPSSPVVGEVGSTEPVRRPMRMHTVVLGMVMLVIAGAVLLTELTDVSVDPGAVVLALMIGGGVLLIAGGRRS
jgi:hypothetical protein